MNEDQTKGTLEKAGGHIKESAGALVGDRKLESEGQADQVKGSAQKAWGDTKDAVNDQADKS